MLLATFLIILGLVLLYFGAEFLVGGAASSALRFGVSPLVAGLTVVSIGTSMPELVVSIKAALDGLPGLALGNIVGSNIFNVTVILGLAALMQPLKVELQLLRLDVPLMIALTAILALAIWTGGIERWLGAMLVGTCAIYLIWQIVASRRESNPKVEEEFAEAMPSVSSNGWIDLGKIVLGGALLALGGRWLVDGAVDLARYFEVKESLIGLTIVAAGTSAPELASTIVAAIKKEADIAIGNVVGSNIFNILSVAGISSLIVPLHAQGIGHLEIGMLLVTAVLLFPIARSGFVVSRWEGGLLISLQLILWFLLWPS
jgi:cation:H+ antiporter